MSRVLVVMFHGTAILFERIYDMNRVRFAPSPTGSLHVGGVRTALYNWLWAKKTGGKFVLRIEDTDSIRNDPASYDNILRSLDWLGLHWDEGPNVGGDYGPYTQSDRRDIYKSLVDNLIDNSKAYRCNCSADDLDKMRKDHSKLSKDSWKYPGICRDKNVSKDLPHVVRFKVDSGAIISYDDLVFGTVKTPSSSLYDFVIMRETGIPLYNLAAVIDDHLMDINLVARGRDHMINTPAQILLYSAFGWDVPSFAHLPMLLNMNGEKLSKRDGSASVDQFKELGFSANGLLNYLIRFGWASGDQELFSVDDMVRLFSWDDCKKSDGKFDLVKAVAINGKNLMKKDLVSDDTYSNDLKCFCPTNDVGIVNLIRPKAKTYKEAANLLSFMSDGSLDKHGEVDLPGYSNNAKIVNDILDLYATTDEWTKNNLMLCTRTFCDYYGLKFSIISQSIRLWVTNNLVGPDIYDIMVYLGKDKILSMRDPVYTGKILFNKMRI